jgi:hypothetical protein
MITFYTMLTTLFCILYNEEMYVRHHVAFNFDQQEYLYALQTFKKLQNKIDTIYT